MGKYVMIKLMKRKNKTPKPKHNYALKNNNGTKGVLGGSGEFWTKISEKSEKKWNSK